MALKTNGFELGPDAAALTASNSGNAGESALTIATAGTGGSIVYRAADALLGSYCAHMTQATAATQPVVLQMSDTGAALFSARIYARITGYPSAESTWGVQLRSTTDTRICSMALSTTGFLRLYGSNATTAVASGSVVMALNTWYRLEMQGSGLNGAAGSLAGQLFAGHSPTALDSISASGLTTTGLVDRIRYGRHGVATMSDWKFDGLAQNIGSSSAVGPAATGGRYVMRGGQLLPMTLQVRRGGVLV